MCLSIILHVCSNDCKSSCPSACPSACPSLLACEPFYLCCTADSYSVMIFVRRDCLSCSARGSFHPHCMLLCVRRFQLFLAWRTLCPEPSSGKRIELYLHSTSSYVYNESPAALWSILLENVWQHQWKYRLLPWTKKNMYFSKVEQSGLWRAIWTVLDVPCRYGSEIVLSS